MKPKNVKDIRLKSALFGASFLLLSIFSFLSVFATIKSYHKQQEYISSDIAQYKALLNKEYVLHTRVDSLYHLMDLLGTGKVENDLFLEKYIADFKNSLLKDIGEDSLHEFRHYHFIATKLNDILALKDSIRLVSEREVMAQRDLYECMNKTRKVKQDLSLDPTRNFSR